MRIWERPQERLGWGHSSGRSSNAGPVARARGDSPFQVHILTEAHAPGPMTRGRQGRPEQALAGRLARPGNGVVVRSRGSPARGGGSVVPAEVRAEAVQPGKEGALREADGVELVTHLAPGAGREARRLPRLDSAAQKTRKKPTPYQQTLIEQPSRWRTPGRLPSATDAGLQKTESTLCRGTEPTP